MAVNEHILRKVIKGDKLSAREANEIIRLLKRAITGPYVQETATGWHIRKQPPPPTFFLAEITGVSTADARWHAWKEIDSWGVATGREGTVNPNVNEAYELNDREGVPVGTWVYMRAESSAQGDTYFYFDLGTGIVGVGKAVGTTAETEAAQTDTWDVTNQGTDEGLEMIMLTRTAYDHTSDETLYGYYRTFSFGSNGHLTDVSAETRVTIDAPDVCP